MFDRYSYIGYTAIFCLPPLVLLWLRREFFEVLCANLREILISTAILTVYGSLIWPIALEAGAWAYGPDKISGVKLFGYVYLDDLAWWLLVSLLFSSFVTLSTRYEDQGVDIVLREVKGLLRSFANALRGLRIIPLERNSTIHVAVTLFVLLEALLFKLSSTEWMLVVLAIGAVLACELLNGVLERIASRAALSSERVGEAGAGGQSPRLDPEIALIKDAAAAAVLISATAAAVVGLLIFLRRFVAALS